MQYKIIKNPDNAAYAEIAKIVSDNGGYCPCEIFKNKDTKCMCKKFRDQDNEGPCHCGRYIKIKE